MIRQPSYFERMFWRIIWKPKYTGAGEQIQFAIDYLSGTLLLDVDGLTINGALHYTDHQDGVHITHLGSRKKGTGSALVERVQQLGKPITLNSYAHNFAFYEKLGFVKQEDTSPAKMIYTPS